MNDPIDAVVTWVNGNDPVHREKRARFGEAQVRSAEQFVPASLSRHLELRAGARLHPRFPEAFLRPNHHEDTIDRVLTKLLEGRYAMGCVQELSRFAPSMRNRIENALDALTTNSAAKPRPGSA